MSNPDRPAGVGKSLRFPWWVSVLLAVGCYCTLKYLVPQLAPEGSSLARLAQAASSFAPILTIALLLLAAKQLYDGVEPDEDEDEDGDEESRGE